MKKLTRDETVHGECYYIASEVDALLAQPVQEPIAWRWGNKKLNGGYEWRYTTYKTQPDAIPLYSAPQKRNT